jgi:hypothetical protein
VLAGGLTLGLTCSGLATLPRCGRPAWADAHAALSLIDQSSSLAAEVLELLATAIYLLGYMGCRVNPCWRGPTR